MADAPIRVLVIDDDEVDRLQVRRLLARAGLNVTVSEAASGQAASELLAGAGTCDLILLDYLLSGDDGLAFLASVPAETRPPVVVLTGQGDERLAVAVMKAGAADYLIKGELTPERLQITIGNAIAAEQDRRQARAAELALARSNVRSKALGSCARILLLDPGTIEALRVAMRPLLAAIEADRLILALNDENAQDPGWATRAEVLADAVPPASSTGSWRSGYRSWRLVLGGGESIVQGLAGTAPQPAPTLAGEGVRGVVAVPLYGDGRWTGFLRADRVRSDEPFPNEVCFFLQSAGDLLTAWLERHDRHSAESAGA